GRAIALGLGGLAFEPQGQLIYTDRGLDDAFDGATQWRFSLEDALVGRLGLRLKSTVALDASGERKATGYIKTNLWSVLLGGDDALDIGSLPVKLQGRSTWADAGIGFSIDAANGF